MYLFQANLYLIRHAIKPLAQCRFKTTAIPYNMLRPYQKECIATTILELEQGSRKQIVSLPVGNVKHVCYFQAEY